MNALALNSVDFSFPGVLPLQVIESITLEFTPGSLSVIVGPSGCGKSTLLNLIAGLLTPTKGTIQWAPEDAPKNAGYVFQAASLIPWRTVRENALFGAEITGCIGPDVKRRCDEMFVRYRLDGFENAYPSSLSGGMQQRVSIIRAVLSGARVILLDEPFSNTDFLMKRDLQTELASLISEEKLIAVLVTHDIEEAARIADKIVILTARPAQVKEQICIPIPAKLRIKGGTAIMKDLASYVERVETAFKSTSLERRS